MEKDITTESLGQQPEGQEIDVTTTRAHYFKRNDKNEVSHDALDSYATWMIADALKIEDYETKTTLLNRIQKAVAAGRISGNAEIGFSELFNAEIEYIARGNLAIIQLQEQVS